VVTRTSAESRDHQRLTATPAATAPVALLAVAVAAAAVLKWTAYVVLGRGLNLFETGTTIVGGLRLLSGQMPYVDFFAFYGPLTYLFPGLAAKAAGSVTTADFVLDLLVGTASAVVAYLVATRLSRRPVLALLAPLILLLLGANTARTLPALLSVLLLIRAERTGRRIWLFVAGAAGGVGLLWIQDAGAWICVAVLVTALGGLVLPAARRVLSAGRFMVYAAGVAAALVPWITFCIVRGSLGAWIHWTFVFPLTRYTERSSTAYLETLFGSAMDAGALRGLYILAFWVIPFVAIFLVAAIAVVFALIWVWRAWRSESGSVGVAAPVSFLVLAVYGLLQLRVLAASIDEAKLIDSAAPTIVAAVVLVLASVPSRDRIDSTPTAVRVAAIVLAAWLVVWPAWWQGRLVTEAIGEPGPQASEAVGGLPFTAAAPPLTTPAGLDEVVRVIHQHTGPDDPILVLPTSPLLYAIADRTNPTGYDYLDPVYTTPEVDAAIAAALRDGEVAVVVLGDNDFPGSAFTGREIAPETYSAIDTLYTEVAEVEGFTVLARLP